MNGDPTPLADQPLEPEDPHTPTNVTVASTQDERTLALLCHLGGLFTSFVLPLILWMVKKDESKFVAEHAREAVNFQISLIIYYSVSAFALFLLIGIVLLPAVLVFEIVVVIQASMAASRGEMYTCPWTIRFVK